MGMINDFWMDQQNLTVFNCDYETEEFYPRIGRSVFGSKSVCWVPNDDSPMTY